MQNHIPENTISDIRKTADIVEVVSDSVMLKKAGKDFVGLCPFHPEKTPSFTVSPEKQIYYCFGCGAGGNVFSFLMAYEGLSFPEAVKSLAVRYGIEIPVRDLDPEAERRISEKEQIYSINKAASSFFRETLLHSDAGKKALAYLEKRGITAQTSEDFQLGYAPLGWDSLLKFFSGKKTDMALLEKAGLIVQRKERPGFYDRFRDRLMFPITDPQGRVAGFGGRVMDDSLPKYLNSPESPVFSKGQILYGFGKSRQKIRECGKVFMVEGYFDVISLHQHGIRNAVAAMGTALTADHLKLLRGNAKESLLVFDSDQAGIRAARRSIDIFRAENMDARILVLPEGEDPDSFVLKSGPAAFAEAADRAVSIMNFLMEESVKNHGLSVEGRMRIIADMQMPLTDVRDPVARSLYIRELAERIGVDEAMIAEKFRHGFEKAEARSVPSPVPDATPAGMNGSGRIRMEQKILAMMIGFPEIIPELEERDIIGQFENPDLRSAGKMILSLYGDSGTAHSVCLISDLMNRLEDREMRHMIASLSMGEEMWIREGCLSLLAQFERGKSRGNRDLLLRIESARKENNQERLKQLLQEKQNQARERLSTT
ncbi:MAG: DNA primase [Desulfococcaceae bacterium]